MLQKLIIIVTLVLFSFVSYVVADPAEPIDWDYRSPLFNSTYVSGEMMPIDLEITWGEWMWEDPVYFFLEVPLLSMAIYVGGSDHLYFTGPVNGEYKYYYYSEARIPSANSLGVPTGPYYAKIWTSDNPVGFNPWDAIPSQNFTIRLLRRSDGEDEISLPEGDGIPKSLANISTWGEVKSLYR